MEFGANTWIWCSPLTSADLPVLVPHIAHLGFQWIEFPIETPDGYDYALAGELARAHGLQVSIAAAITAERDLTHPDPTIRANGVAFIEHCLDAAQLLGASRIIGPLYAAVGRTWQATPAERERDIELLVQQLRPLAERAENQGVALCLEPLNRFETSFINLATQAIEVVDRVGHPGCQLMLDTFHMNIEERSLGEAIRTAGPRLKHFHACENDRGAPGSGHLNWPEIAAALREINYTGPVVIESFTDKVQSIARAAAIWRPLAASPDHLAKEGLQFLQQLFQTP